MEMSGQLHAPAALPPGKIPRTNWIGSCVGRCGNFGEVKTHGFIWNQTPAVQSVARRAKRKQVIIKSAYLQILRIIGMFRHILQKFVLLFLSCFMRTNGALPSVVSNASDIC
jgi:hypothetical protein